MTYGLCLEESEDKVGGAVVTGLDTLFGTTRFISELMFVVCGALTVIGSYFNITIQN